MQFTLFTFVSLFQRLRTRFIILPITPFQEPLGKMDPVPDSYRGAYQSVELCAQF